MRRLLGNVDSEELRRKTIRQSAGKNFLSCLQLPTY